MQRYKWLWLLGVLFVVGILTVSATAAQPSPKAVQNTGNGPSTGDLALTFDGIYETDTWSYPGSMVQTSRGTIIGGAQKTGSYSDARVMLIDRTGAVVWHRTFGGPHNDGFAAAIQTQDGGYLFAGIRNGSEITWDPGLEHGDVFLQKMDSRGTVEWQTVYDAGGAERATDVVQRPSGEFVVSVHQPKPGRSQLIEVSENGTVQGTLKQDPNARYGHLLESDGDLVVAGRMKTNDTGYSAFVAKFTDSTTVWREAFSSPRQRVADLTETDRGTYAIVGINFDNNFTPTGYLAEVNAKGERVAYHRYEKHLFRAVAGTSDGFIVGGTDLTGPEPNTTVAVIDRSGRLSTELTADAGTAETLIHVEQASGIEYALSGPAQLSTGKRATHLVRVALRPGTDTANRTGNGQSKVANSAK